jgi:hypothetical protein
MNTFSNHIATRPVQTVFKLACIAAILAGCGGGGDSGTTSTTSFASGPIQGFGSIIVNGVRFDDSSAKVSSEDDDNGESRNRSELKLGMVVDVQGGATSSDDSGRHGKANDIRFGSELVGPVTALAADGFTLIGQTVKVSTMTLFDDSVGGAVKVGDVLEVHGLYDAAAKIYNATRVEIKAAPALFKIRGAIEDLQTTAKTFKIGGELISYEAASSVPNPLENGQIVRVKLHTNKNTANAWVATKVKSGVRKVEDHNEAEIKGTITAFNSVDAFEVNGLKVDATGVTNKPAGLAKGVSVEIHGRSANGVIIANRIEIEDRNGAGAGEFEFHRRVVSSDIQGKTFVLDTTTIGWDANTSFEKGATAASLTPNTCVEVKAVTVSGNTNLRATRIKLDNSCTQ